MRRRCNRTRIVSTAIEASLDRRCNNHRFQRGLVPPSGTLSRPSPHVYAQALKFMVVDKGPIGGYKCLALDEVDGGARRLRHDQRALFAFTVRLAGHFKEEMRL